MFLLSSIIKSTTSLISIFFSESYQSTLRALPGNPWDSTEFPGQKFILVIYRLKIRKNIFSFDVKVMVSVYFRRRNRICFWAGLLEGDVAEVRWWIWRLLHRNIWPHPYLTASSLFRRINFWYLSCFYSPDSFHAVSDLQLSSAEKLPKKKKKNYP